MIDDFFFFHLILFLVCKVALEDGLAQNTEMTMGNIKQLLREEIYYPDYAPLIS